MMKNRFMKFRFNLFLEKMQNFREIRNAKISRKICGHFVKKIGNFKKCKNFAKIHQKQQKIRKNAKFSGFFREISFLFRVIRFIHSPEIIRNFASLRNTNENFRSFSRKVSFAANPTLIPSVVSLWKGWRQDITLHTVILAANLKTEHF